MILEKVLSKLAKNEKSITHALVIAAIGVLVLLTAFKIIPAINAKTQGVFPTFSPKEIWLYFYLAGLGFAVSILALNAIYSLLRWNTPFIQNMKSAGYKYNPLTGSVQWGDYLMKFWFVNEWLMMMILVATSWVYVFGVVVAILIRLSAITRKPEKITEIDYILSSNILPKNAIQNLLIEKRKFLKLEPEPFEQDLYTFKLDGNSWAELFPDIQELKINSRSDDYLSSSEEILQYRIIDENIEARTREHHSDGAGVKKEYEICDYVYIESNIRFSMLTSDEWKDNTRWHLVQNSRIVYQILKIHHPEYRRILRQKDENNKRKVRIAKEEITKLEIPLYETNFGLWLVDLEENQGKATDELLAQIETKQKKIQPIFDKINFDPYAFWHHKEFEKEISEVLEGA